MSWLCSWTDQLFWSPPQQLLILMIHCARPSHVHSEEAQACAKPANHVALHGQWKPKWHFYFLKMFVGHAFDESKHVINQSKHRSWFCESAWGTKVPIFSPCPAASVRPRCRDSPMVRQHSLGQRGANMALRTNENQPQQMDTNGV